MLDLEDSLLDLHFGTPAPFWRLYADSDALHLSGQNRGDVSVALPLKPNQAEAIRRLSGATSHLDMEIALYGEPVRLHMIGRRVDRMEWAGTAVDYRDTASVTRSLVSAVSSSEEVLAEVNSLVVLVDSDLKIRRFNRLCEEVTGYKESEVLGKDVHDGFIVESDKDEARKNMRAFFATGNSFEVERPCIGKNGVRRVLWRNKMVRSGSGPSEWYLVCSGTDVTEERLAQERLVELANSDSLTKLPNRHAVEELMKKLIASGSKFALMFIDLDNFKNVNDHYGHHVGDRLIQSVATSLKQCLADGAVLARFGGDEFLAILPEQDVEAVNDAFKKIETRLNTSFMLGSVELYSGCSVGVALFPEHGTSQEELLRNADVALYDAKKAGRRMCRIFHPDMNKKAGETVWLDTNLRKAIQEQHFELYYQPKVHLKTGHMAGVEALVRWNSPERGVINPDEFIPYAEASGLIHEIGRWVMEEAAWQSARWKKQGLDIPIAINLSARQLRSPDLVKEYSRAILSSGSDPSMVGLELTESCMVEDEALASQIIRGFRDIGALIYLDDFGTGYSSLSHLSRMPIDVLKLDRSFISSVHSDVKARALVRSMVVVAQELKISVIAEGVETEDQAQFLRELGVEMAQGYLFAHPMRVPELEDWVNTNSRKLRVVAA